MEKSLGRKEETIKTAEFLFSEEVGGQQGETEEIEV